MAKHKSKALIPNDMPKEEALKLIADQMYSDAEHWIRAAMESDNVFYDLKTRTNESHALKKNHNRTRPVLSLSWR